MIAWFITHELVTRSDAIFDLHSAGSSIDHWPSCKIRLMGDEPEKDAMQMDFLKLFGAPLGIVGDRVHMRTLSGEASPNGIVYLSTELGGGGKIRPWIRDFGYNGMLALPEAHGARCVRDYETAPVEREVRLMAMQKEENYIFAASDGMFEPRVNLGDEVADDQFAGYLSGR